MVEVRTCPHCGAQLEATAPDAPCPACLMKLGMDSWLNRNTVEPTIESPVAGGAFVAPQPEELADRLPDYEVLELLGSGGMGAVYKARQKSLDRLVAIKIIKPNAANNPGFAERFHREAKALARLNHANIVGVIDYRRVDGLFYVVMEFVDGTNLRRLIESRNLPPERAIELVPQICDALQFAHDEGIVHRDIKPENILVDSRGRVKIADFGLAKMLGQPSGKDDALTGTHQVMGTPRYMAPEQMEGSKAVDHRADIYSLGVVFYEMLTGELPLGRFDPPSRKGTIDEEWDAVVMRTLEKEPDRRYQHASEVKSEVERISDLDRPPVRLSSPVHDQPAAAASESPTTPHYGLLIFGGVMALLGLLLLMISTAEGGIVFTWIGIGIALAGGGCFTGAFNETSRLPAGTHFNAGLMMQGAVWVLIGFSLLMYCFAQERGPWSFQVGNAFVWVAIGLVISGGGCFAGAWKKPTQQFDSSDSRRIADSTPRYSRKAILGACWAPLFFLAIVPSVLISEVETTGPSAVTRERVSLNGQVSEPSHRATDADHFAGASPRSPWWSWLLLATLLPLGLTAPFGTTILGLVAISNIRHSYGRLTGMPLAVADALLYPLLVLDGLILGLAVCLAFLVVFMAGSAGARSIPILVIAGPAVLIALPICVVVDVFIARAAWRKAISGMK